MKKKMLAIVLVLAMVFTLAGCGGGGGGSIDGDTYDCPNATIETFSNYGAECLGKTGEGSYGRLPSGGFVYKAEGSDLLLYAIHLFATSRGNLDMFDTGSDQLVKTKVVGDQTTYYMNTVKYNGQVQLTMLLKSVQNIESASSYEISIYPGDMRSSFEEVRTN